MIYDFAITLGKQGSATARVERELNLTKGFIHRLDIQFPIGTLALAHCQLLHHRHQVWPTNLDGSFASDGYVIAFDESYELKYAPYTLVAICWNDDDTYPHTITIRIGILESKTAIMAIKMITGLTRFLKLAGIRI